MKPQINLASTIAEYLTLEKVASFIDAIVLEKGSPKFDSHVFIFHIMREDEQSYLEWISIAQGSGCEFPIREVNRTIARQLGYAKYDKIVVFEDGTTNSQNVKGYDSPVQKWLSVKHADSKICSCSSRQRTASISKRIACIAAFAMFSAGIAAAQTLKWDCGACKGYSCQPTNAVTAVLNIADGTLTISGKGNMADHHYPWQDYRDAIKTIIVSRGVTSIGDYSFNECLHLSKVAFPNTLVTIGVRAFYGCSKLESITIPASVTTIKGSAFCDCVSLRNVDIGDGVMTIETQAFAGNESLETVSIGAGKKNFGYYAFGGALGNRALRNVIIKESAPVSVNYDVFPHKSMDLYVPSESIPLYKMAKTWKESRRITAIGAKPGPVKWVGNQTATITVTLDDGCLTITGSGRVEGYPDDSCENYRNAIKSVVIEDGITSFTHNTSSSGGDGFFPDFYNCMYLRSVSIPKSFTFIYYYESGGGKTSRIYNPFSMCKSLTAINVDKDNPYHASVDGVLFDKNKEILFIYPRGKTDTLYKIPSSVTIIAGYAFKNSTNLTSLIIPQSVTGIGSSFISECNITSIYNFSDIPQDTEYHSSMPRNNANPPEYFGDGDVFDDFNNIGQCILYVPKGSISAYGQTWYMFKNILKIP